MIPGGASGTRRKRRSGTWRTGNHRGKKKRGGPLDIISIESGRKNVSPTVGPGERKSLHVMTNGIATVICTNVNDSDGNKLYIGRALYFPSSIPRHAPGSVCKPLALALAPAAAALPPDIL